MKKLFKNKTKANEAPVHYGDFRSNRSQLERINRYLEEQLAMEGDVPSPTTTTNSTTETPFINNNNNNNSASPSVQSSNGAPSSTTSSTSSGSDYGSSHPLPPTPTVVTKVERTLKSASSSPSLSSDLNQVQNNNNSSVSSNSSNGNNNNKTTSHPLPLPPTPTTPATPITPVTPVSNNNNNSHSTSKTLPNPKTKTNNNNSNINTNNNNNSNNTSVQSKILLHSSSLPNADAFAAIHASNQQQKFLELTEDVNKIPPFIYEAIVDIEQRGIRSEGIFRLGSPKNKMDDLWQVIVDSPLDQQHTLHIDYLSKGDVNLTANILKKYLRELREPLIPFELYEAFLKAGANSNGAIPVTPTTVFSLASSKEDSVEHSIASVLKAACDQLSPARHKLLGMLCELWWKVASNHTVNRMTPHNISIVVQPNILYSRTRTPQEVMANMKHEHRVISDLIVFYEIIFAKSTSTVDTDVSDEGSSTEKNTDCSTDVASDTDVQSKSTTSSDKSPSAARNTKSENKSSTFEEYEDESPSVIASEQQLMMEIQKRRNIIHQVVDKSIADGGVYTGGVNSAGLMHSQGRLTLSDGSVYTGEFSNNKYNGKGDFVESNGAKFSGNWYNGAKNGRGVMNYADKSRYAGNWYNDARAGDGVMTYADGSVYDGDWDHDAPNGYGTFISNGVRKYTGYWRDGQYHGSGTLELISSNTMYKGEFSQGKFNGKGRYTTVSTQGKHKFKGKFLEGKPWTGKGSVAFDSNTILTGKWNEGELAGTALIFFEDGRGYNGEVDTDHRPNGRGIMTYTDDTQYIGSWKKGTKSGLGTLIMTNGITYEGSFDDDLFHGNGKLINTKQEVIFDGEFRDNKPWKGTGVVIINRDTFDGTYYDGVFYGSGTCYNESDESIYEGPFENSMCHGQGKLTFVDGSTFQGLFRSNRKIQGILRDKNGTEFKVEYDWNGAEESRQHIYRDLSAEEQKEVTEHKMAQLLSSWKRIKGVDAGLVQQVQSSIQQLTSQNDKAISHMQPMLDMLIQLTTLADTQQSTTTDEQ